jgi:hypothetical protein
MVRIFEYAGRYQRVQSSLTGLPSWAKLILFVFALPGLIGVALSILALGVSILALSLLTVPAYRLLSAVVRGRRPPEEPVTQEMDAAASPGRRHVDVTILE